MVSLFDAISLVDKALKDHIAQTEVVSIEDAIDRISATNIKCKIPLPPFDNSAMDGYAVCGDGKRFEIVSKIFAGDTKSYTLKAKEAYRIFTGAKVPKNCDYVIPQEMVKIENDQVVLDDTLKKGANIRRSGEDIDIDDNILDIGDRIDSSHIALLASQGIGKVEVFCKTKVAVFASGSELKMIGEKIKDGEIYNSNTPYLIARAKELGAEVLFLGKSQDDKESLKRVIEEGLEADLIVTSGGISVGEADLTKDAFFELGMDTIFNKISIKPGKPTTFGKIGKSFVLNLPGNPLASALNFEIVGKFIINRLSGSNSPYQNYIMATLKDDIYSPKPVSNVVVGNFDGSSFHPLKGVSPGNVNVLNRSNSFVVIDQKKDLIKKDEIIKVIPISWRFFSREFVDFTS